MASFMFRRPKKAKKGPKSATTQIDLTFYWLKIESSYLEDDRLGQKISKILMQSFKILPPGGVAPLSVKITFWPKQPTYAPGRPNFFGSF